MAKLFIKKSRLLFTVVMLLSMFGASAQQNTDLINAQLSGEREKYGLTAGDISDYLITDQYTDKATGITYAYIQQRHNKVVVYNAVSVFLIKDNKVLYFKPGMIDHLAQKVKTAGPNITPEAAIGYALMHIGRDKIAPVKLLSRDNNLNTLTYESPSISANPIKVQLVYRAMDDGIYLAWDVSIELKNEPHWWNVRIDALTGNYIDKNDWTVSCSFDDPDHHCAIPEHKPAAPASLFSPLPPPPPLGEYNVYPFPIEAPSFGGRSILINPEDLSSSPFGWHDVDGVAGNEYTITRGNNVHAYEDANNDNLPGYSPNSATLQFNYPVDLAQAPIVNQDASITNLFYLNNRIHDVLSHVGFNEAAGNFQQNNYGNGGLGNDYVQAEAFDGSGTNNANFGTPADGSRPRMQMYLWTAPNPDRDGSFDNGIVAHEYGHGVSNRLTGGPAQASCLTNAEQGGEGWSDWLALIMTIEPGDTASGGMLTQARGIGTYALNQPTTGQGIRRFRYSVNMAINPQTYADLATSGTGPHAKGEIWCDAIWDMTCFLVNDLGFNSDPTVATAGNNIAMRLVLEGMKLQPCSPGFLDARDAILNADAILYGNAHRCRIWEAFARRGMGFSAVQGSSNSSTDQTAAFNLPPFCLAATQPPVAAFTSNLSTIPCAGTVRFTDGSTQAFNWAWDFGDGGTSILTNPSHQYTSPGTYNVKLVVTNPLGSDSVIQIITVTSTITANLTATPNPVLCGSPVQLNAVGSGSSNINYSVASIPFAPVTGTPIGGPTGDDIVSSFIPIGFNFPFYNSVQTQLKISTNGFISFNSNPGAGCCAGSFLPNNSSTLSNLIAVAWTDLFVGAPNSIDYFNLTSPNRFVIRWNAVAHCCTTTPPQVTAQIILYETGEIEMHNTSIIPGPDVMTMGIENANGTVATVVPGRNASNFTASNEAYRFTPAVNYTYLWQPGNLNGASQTVNPIANTTYTVNVADGSGCVVPFTTALINVTPITATISGNLSFCAGGSTTLDAGEGYSGYSWSTGATTQTISVNTAGTYTVTVTTASGCTATSPAVTTTVNPLPTPAISGTLAFCAGGSTTLDAGEGYAIYNWSTSATSQTISVNTAGTFTVTVTDGNGCTGTSPAVTTTVNPIVNAGTVSGISPLLVTQTATYSSTGDAGGTWSSTNPAVASVNSTSGFVTALSAGTTDITYTVTGCGGPQSAFQALTVNPDIQNPGTVTGTTPLCIGATATYSSDGDGGGTWSSTNPAVASVNPTSGLVTALSAGTTDITYTVTGPASSFQTLTVSPNVNAGTVTGTSPICIATSTTFSSNGNSGGTWSSSNPSVATVNPTTGSVTGVFAGTATITYTISSGCGSPLSASASVTVASGAAPTVTGIINVCKYVGTGTQLTYTATAVGATSFQWVVPPTVTIVSGQGTNSIVITANNGFIALANKQLRVTALSPCGTSPQTIYYLSAQLPTTPSPIVASTNNICPSIGTNVPVTYTIPRVTDASSYIWTAQAGTTTITSINGPGVNDTSVTVTFSSGFTTSAITVRAVNDCGTTNARSFTITRNNPGIPALISGPTNVCSYIAPNGTPATYSVAPVANATGYNWTVPAGSTGLTGQGTNSISFIYSSGFTSGTVTVTASNGCGVSATRSLSVAKLNPATPGIIDVQNLVTCPNRQYSYTIATMPANAQSVQWTAPAGATIVSGQGTTSIVVSYPNTAVNGTVTATAVNNCGSSVVRFITIKLPACPPVEPPPPFAGNNNPLFKGNVAAAAEAMNVNVYPNPTTTDFKLQVLTAGKEEISVRVLDMAGRFIKQVTVMPYQTINIGAELKAGLYMIEVRQGSAIKTTRVIKF